MLKALVNFYVNPLIPPHTNIGWDSGKKRTITVDRLQGVLVLEVLCGYAPVLLEML